MIFYEMMYGVTPYTAKSQFQLVQNILNEKVKFPDNIKISEESKDFILKCLIIDEKERMSWEEAFTHPLFKGKFSE